MKIEECNLYFKELLKSIGLQNFEMEMYYFGNKSGYGVILKRSLDYIDVINQDNLLNNVLKPIVDDVTNSPAVKSRLSELETKLMYAKEEIKHLENKIAELSVFKNYYDMQYKLNNG